MFCLIWNYELGNEDYILIKFFHTIWRITNNMSMYNVKTEIQEFSIKIISIHFLSFWTVTVRWKIWLFKFSLAPILCKINLFTCQNFQKFINGTKSIILMKFPTQCTFFADIVEHMFLFSCDKLSEVEVKVCNSDKNRLGIIS